MFLNPPVALRSNLTAFQMFLWFSVKSLPENRVDATDNYFKVTEMRKKG